jgi:hypothetical protein
LTQVTIGTKLKKTFLCFVTQQTKEKAPEGAQVLDFQGLYVVFDP